MTVSVKKMLAPVSDHIKSPGTAAPGSNAHVVFSARAICNPNPRHYAISCVKCKHCNSQTCCCVHVRGVCVCIFLFFRIAPGSQKARNETFGRNVEFVDAFWNSYICCQNVELSTGKRDSTTVKGVVPRDLLGRRRTLWLERELVALRYRKETTVGVACPDN